MAAYTCVLHGGTITQLTKIRRKPWQNVQKMTIIAMANQQHSRLCASLLIQCVTPINVLKKALSRQGITRNVD
jgi:hypothetical protein